MSIGAVGDGVVVWLPVEVPPGVGVDPVFVPVEAAGGVAGAGVAAAGGDVCGAGVGVGVGDGLDEVAGGVTFGSVLLPVLVDESGVVVVSAGGVVVAAGGGVVAGGVCATWAALTCACVGGVVWSSRSAAYEAATAPATSSASSPRSVAAARRPGVGSAGPAANLSRGLSIVCSYNGDDY